MALLRDCAGGAAIAAMANSKIIAHDQVCGLKHWLRLSPIWTSDVGGGRWYRHLATGLDYPALRGTGGSPGASGGFDNDIR